MNKHIKTLKKFISWRRGEEIDMPKPKDIGLALDYAIGLVKENERLNLENSQLSRRIYEHNCRVIGAPTPPTK